MFTIYVSILEWNPAFLILYHTNQTACKSVENSVSCDAFHASIGSVYVSTDDGITRHQSTNTQQVASTTCCGLRARRYRRASKHNSVIIDITGIESEAKQLEWAAAVSAVLCVYISMCYAQLASNQEPPFTAIASSFQNLTLQVDWFPGRWLAAHRALSLDKFRMFFINILWHTFNTLDNIYLVGLSI